MDTSHPKWLRCGRGTTNVFSRRTGGSEIYMLHETGGTCNKGKRLILGQVSKAAR